MPRSSGQNATPSRAMRSEGSAMICVPSKRIEPSRRATMPMMALRVVVLPTPLRPSSVTTSPRRTSNCAPCRMWDSPYHAFRSATESSTVSGMLGTQVGLDHLRMSGHRPVIALGDDLTAREDGDVIGEVLHDAEVVLDHEDGALGGDAPDERRDALDVRVRHAGRGLIEEHHFRIERERGRDLERALAPVGQLHRDRLFERRQAYRVQQLAPARIQVAQHAVRSPEIERAAALALQRDAHVLQDREMRKHRRNLERPDQPQPGDRGGAGTGDLAPVVEKLPPGRGNKVREQIEAGGVARAVGADERVDASAPDLEADVAEGDETLELLPQAARFENDAFRHGCGENSTRGERRKELRSRRRPPRSAGRDRRPPPRYSPYRRARW